jgi:hypothetical protein
VDLPLGAIGLAGRSDGVVLRFNTEKREWERLAAQAPLRALDRLLSLAPYRTTLELGAARVDLVGETEVAVRTAGADQAARLVLIQGRVVLHGVSSAAPFGIDFAGRSVSIAPPAGVAVGLERGNRRDPGAPVASDPVLKLFAPEGTIALAADGAEKSLTGPGTIALEPRGSWGDSTQNPAPAWVSEPSASPFDKQIGEQFLRFFRPERSIIAVLVEASEDDQKDVRRLAISALRAVGDISMIVPVLQKRDDPIARRAAIAVLRAYLAQGPDAAKALHDQLQNDLGVDLAAKVEKLLVGYTRKEARDDSTYTALVQDLATDDPALVGVRELALSNLQALTGRDDLDYDPDRPEGKGLRAWKELLRNHELRPQAEPGPR